MFTETSSQSAPGSTTSHTPKPYTSLDIAIALAAKKLLNLQSKPGYWVFELEADCTISAEYILMMHFMDEINQPLQGKIANYLRKQQSLDGSYALYSGGEGDLSCTLKVYYALKMAGDSPDSVPLSSARQWILANGGAVKANVFTRIMLAMFEQLPWRATPFMPVEIMLLPHWFPFHLDKVSYWSRTVMIPLLILTTFQVKARNPTKTGIQELFVTPPNAQTDYFSQVTTPLGKALLLLDKLGRRCEPLIPSFVRCKATNKARAWYMARLNGEDGLGAIFTAMVNVYEAMDYLNMPADNQQRQVVRAAINRLLVIKDDSAYCQPCVSPIWDTGLVTLTLQEVDQAKTNTAIQTALKPALHWLASKQLKDEPGDWRLQCPLLAGGGWAFQFGNSHYPDLDDSAVVALALLQANDLAYATHIDSAAVWIAGMQSKNGGYGAFDVDNTSTYLNQIPFADHGALLDPPTADVSSRCLMFLAHCLPRHPEYQQTLNNCLAYLRQQQEQNGAWFGRWGTNYIYGTWSVLAGFASAGIATDDPAIRKAVVWLNSTQGPDGGWGETNDSYQQADIDAQPHPSTAFHTALALLALLSVGETNSAAVLSGVIYLLKNQQLDGFWPDAGFNAPGFPKFFYLKYHGYPKFFPLWALARYRNLREAV